MRDVVIASYVRSAQSRCRPNDPGRDWLFTMRTDDLVAKLLPEALDRAKTKPDEVDDHIIGCAQAVHRELLLLHRAGILVLAGAIMAFTRSLGETGATLSVVENANTVPVYIVGLIQQGSDFYYPAALACIALIAISFITMMLMRYITIRRAK